MNKQEWPARIWLQREDADNRPDVESPDGATWCQDQINTDDVEYIRVDLHKAAVARAKRSGEPQTQPQSEKT
jgi:hypothetical protein